jgi:hypothetical protein
MKTKLLLSALFGVAAWSLSSLATAGWVSGPCSGTGTAPCIEVTDNNDDVWHFNGDGSHADVWHGHPLGGDFTFSNSDVDLGCSIASLNCTLELAGQVKKCQDSNGDWRIGVRVTDGSASDGLFCGTVDLYNFPWYSKDPTIASHCPFEDDCDSFIPYDANASTYTGNFGAISVDALGANLVDQEHLHSVVFTPGAVANGDATFDFTGKTFYDCAENGGFSIDGVLQLNNAKELQIY